MSQIKWFGGTVWTTMVGATKKEATAGGWSALVGLLVTFLGGWDKPLQVLLTMMVLDYIFGVLAAIKNKKMESDVMFWGGIRKATVLTVVGLSAQLDNWLQPGAPIFRTAASFLQQLKDKGDGKDATTK